MAMTSRTPPEITERVATFMARLSPGAEAVRIAVTPLPDADLHSCFRTVLARAEANGGELVVGWQIVETPGVMLDAIFHGVWRDPSGGLHDLTPKEGELAEVLFLPDPARKYEGRQVDNQRDPLVDTRAVLDLIAAREALFEFENRGERAFQHRYKLNTGKELGELRELQQAVEMARQVVERNIGQPPPPVATDLCPCGGGKRFAECHGAI